MLSLARSLARLNAASSCALRGALRTGARRAVCVPATPATRAVSRVVAEEASVGSFAVARAGASAGSRDWSSVGVATAALAAIVGAGSLVQAQGSSSEREEDFIAHDMHNMKIFSGNSNAPLASEIAQLLGKELGKITVARFADGEVNVQVHENVRGKDVYIVQSTSPPVNEHLVELLLLVSTMRRASAERITCVIPYYGYARQDRKMQSRVPISAADIARLLEAVGVDRVVAVDLHCGQIQVRRVAGERVEAGK